jgi:glycosyltransferase involved in cell wall biosynthesis
MRQVPAAAIIPAYNAEKTIGRCLESLLKQTALPAEIIVVDDGSGDRTAAVVERFAREYPLIRLLRQNHSGPAVARNAGAARSRQKILVFVDADMEFNPDFLVTLVKPILVNQVKGSWSGEEYVKNWDSVWARCWNYNQGRLQPLMTGGPGQKRVFRAVLKTEFDRVSGFDSIGYTDDWTLVNKLGYQPKATRAKFWHHNPDSLNKVFSQAYWIGKRQYKLNQLGTIFTLVKYNPIFSLISGFMKSINYREPRFFLFKLVYDWGIMRGAGESLWGRRY